VLLVGLGFLALKVYSLHPTLTDDWIYAYLAGRVGEGSWPHRDFFFAHPPVHLLALALVLKITGFSVLAVRLVPALAAAASGLFIWAVARRHGGRLGAFAGWTVFLFSYDVLRSSSHITGANLSLAFLAAGAWFCLDRRWIRGGALLALASLTALYTLPVIGGILGLLALRRPAGWRRAVSGFAAVFIGLQVAVALPAPGEYVDQVYLYHRDKPEQALENAQTWSRAAAHQPAMAMALPVAAGASLALWLAKTKRVPGTGGGRRRRRPAERTGAAGARPAETDRPLLDLMGAGALLVAVQLVFLLRLPELYTYYLQLLYGLLSLLLGLGVSGWVRAVARIVRVRRDGSGLTERVQGLIAGVLVTAAAAGLTEMWRPEPSDIYPVGRRVRYTWRDSPFPAAVDRWVRTWIWKDVRVTGEYVFSATRYLWHESRGLDRVEAVAEEIRRSTAEGDRILGDSMLAPLVALTSGRRLVNDEADTNTKRFTTGMETMDQFIRRMDGEDLAALVFMEGRFLDRFDGFQSWRAGAFPSVTRWEEGEEGILVLARR
jgi:hypothetical protein